MYKTDVNKANQSRAATYAIAKLLEQLLYRSNRGKSYINIFLVNQKSFCFLGALVIFSPKKGCTI